MYALASVQEREDSASVGELLRRTILRALGEIEKTLDAPSPALREIHLARRAAKRVRALARLAPQRLSVLSRQTIKGVGDARRGFGGARDADVRCVTLDELRDDMPAQTYQRLRGRAREASAAHFSADRQASRATIAALMRDWSLCDADAGADEIAEAASKTYRRARRRMKQAAAGGSDALHRWRSAVVDHEYHADFLGAFAPEMRKDAEDADTLRKHLGDLHDLEALADYFRDRRIEGGEMDADVARLDAAIAPQRAKLAEKAARLGEKLYDVRPKKWRRALMKTFAQDGGTQSPTP
jgi:CHAD domain-containing protein